MANAGFFSCSELYVSNAGIAHAIVSFLGDKADGIMCNEYNSQNGRCNKKVEKIMIIVRNNYEFQEYNRSNSYAQIREELTRGKNKREIEELGPEMAEVIKKRRQEYNSFW